MKELSLHITDVCHFECDFCVWGETLHRGVDDIPREELEAFLRENRDGGFEVVNLHGGEPTLRRDLFALLDTVRRYGYPDVSIQTNGWALANPGYARRLVDAGVKLVVISIHGATPEVHDGLVRAEGSLERALAGMDHLRELGVALRTNTVAVLPNLPQLPAVSDLVTAHGVEHVNFSSLMPSGRAWPDDDHLMPPYGETARLVVEAARRAEAAGARVTLEGFPPCTVPGFEDRCLKRDDHSGDQIKCFIRGEVWNNHDTFVEDHLKTKGPACPGCRHEARCPGVYTLYTHSRGWAEFQPVA